MGIIESIKQKICQLDAGSFQNLCDTYLSKTGYPNIVSLGGEAGTRKTTPGTPDTYFVVSNGKYVFVEYTTQKSNLITKIKDDLEKCLDTSKTGVSHDRICEIIYCHTSSNITPSQYSEIKALCEDKGVELRVIGIDKLAEDIYLFHHNISRDFLGISVSTGQIQSYDDFINNYNLNKMAAPIDTEFLFREKELKDIIDSYSETDVVIISGAAGTGKTRLALQYVKNHHNVSDEKLYCIHSNALPIYEDLKLFIDSPGNYLLFIDDANHLSGLQHIIQYVNRKPEGYNVKIIITVRDYAQQKVIKFVRDITSYKVVNINVFSDAEIRELIKISLNIRDQNYQDRIIRISEGNARIAILAGKMAHDSNRLDYINDVSQLYEDYYTSTLDDNQLLVNNKLCITAGVVAFLEAIYLDNIDTLLPIIHEKGIDRESFIEYLYILHEQEIIDIYNDKVVRFSEQCLSNYLLKYVFFDKKLIKLSEMIKICFLRYRERTIFSINTLLNIYRNEDIHNFIKSEINLLWAELEKEESQVFFEFVKVFFLFNSTQTLIILNNKIESEKSINSNLFSIDTEKGKNYQSVTNDIIKILGGYANMTDFPTACDLFMKYYIKRPDLYIEFYHAINLYFSIDKNSAVHNYLTQITFIKKLKEYSDDWKQESVVILFLEVAKKFLQLQFSPAEEVRKNTITIYQIPLHISEGVKKYRGLIWESLLTLSTIEKYRTKVKKIIGSYGGTIEDISFPVLQFDIDYIKKIFDLAFPVDVLEHCVLANHIKEVFNINKIPTELFDEYFKEENFNLYSLLKGLDCKNSIDYDENAKLKQEKIKQYVSICDLNMFKKLIDVCSDIQELEDGTSSEVKEGLYIAFETLNSEKDLYVNVIKYYLREDTPLNLDPSSFMIRLFSILPDSEVYQIVIGEEYSQKNEWIYSYYHELPAILVTQEHLLNLFNFLKDNSDKDIISSKMRDVDFLDKYKTIDEQAFIKGCEIIISKISYSPLMVFIYFNKLFNNYLITSQIISKFNCKLELLEKIYYVMLTYYDNFDYKGRFLKDIYLVKPTLLDKYISYLIDKYNQYNYNQHDRHRCFFDLDNFIEIYNKIFDQLIINCQNSTISVPYFLESLLLPVHNKRELIAKQEEWIRSCIQLFSDDSTKMYCLFSVVSKLDIERKKEYILLFLENNSLLEDFKKIPLLPTTCSWSGSAVPLYYTWIDFLESLLPYLAGSKWLNHKRDIEKRIESLKKQIEFEQIEEIIEGK